MYDDGLIMLPDADREGIGNKARRLAQLLTRRSSLFDIPRGVVVTADWTDRASATDLAASLSGIRAGAFAVRSCALEEDTSKSSLAGKYHTELDVPLGEMSGAVERVRASFGESEEHASVIVQEMIGSDFAGVLFTRAPDNAGLAACEFAKGNAESVVSGKVTPERFSYGRYSGKIRPDTGDPQQAMLAHVFLAGMVIEQLIGKPQDIEWSYQLSGKKLYILQSRDITAASQAVATRREQERVLGIAANSKSASRGRPVLRNAAVREVVSGPSRFTRSLIERLYAPSGALGRAFRILGLPFSEMSGQNYVTSVFGKLYADVDVERKLFGFSLRRWCAGRKLRGRLQRDREAMLQWMAGLVERMPGTSSSALRNNPAVAGSVKESARRVVDELRFFIEDVYPTAYAATILAQMAREEGDAGSSTGDLMHDLSRLHHTGDVDRFLECWGHRSTDDYELSEPRFSEAPERALEYARLFEDLSWAGGTYDLSFTSLKEDAKDRAVKWLSALRPLMMQLETGLGLAAGGLFLLDIDCLEGIAQGRTDPAEAADIAQGRKAEESAWTGIELGDEISLPDIEWLESTTASRGGLRGMMVAERKGFGGRATLVTAPGESDVVGGEVLITKYLEPALVGLFAKTVGCIADNGGALSHAAIVAREMGYPVVVLPGCSDTIGEGDGVDVTSDGKVVLRRATPDVKDSRRNPGPPRRSSVDN